MSVEDGFVCERATVVIDGQQIEGVGCRRQATKLVDYWIPLKSSADADRAARLAADDEGFEVVRTAKVEYAPKEAGVPAWTVKLELRVKAR
jgi:hypothetical protein